MVELSENCNIVDFFVIQQLFLLIKTRINEKILDFHAIITNKKSQYEQVFYTLFLYSCYENNIPVTNCHGLFTYEIFLDGKVCKVDYNNDKIYFTKEIQHEIT